MFEYIATATAVLISMLSLVVTAAADTFGSGFNNFDIEFVCIGNPGNPDDTSGNPNPAGSVAYTYRMGKFEVSRDMITKANSEGGLGITLQDMEIFGIIGGNGADRPATGVSWNEAARFVNWLNTSTGGTAAYKFTTSGVNDNIALWTPSDILDYDPANPFRSLRASYVLPSMDEWFKAAFYNPTTGQYGNFPTSDGFAPTAVTSGTADKTAVFFQSFAQGPADIDQAGGLSAYGIMGMGGNVTEWEETTGNLLNNSGSSPRGFRGGDWVSFSFNLASTERIIIVPIVEANNLGFRVASSVTLGDANNDGVLNNLDITAFGMALFDPTMYATMYPAVDPDCVLDMNNDGSFNNLDIADFGSALGF